MLKRVLSGVFLLVALGALGLILAGALTSGEQLIVRFLTAIIVAALALYVISDLRLQADDSAVARRARSGGPTPNPARVATGGARSQAAPPPNSTAAFMATVTGKRSAVSPSALLGDPAGAETTGKEPGTPLSHGDPITAAIDAATKAHEVTEGGGDAELNRTVPGAGTSGDAPVSPLASPGLGIDIDELLRTPYEQDSDDEEVTSWPLTAEFKALSRADLEASAADDDARDDDGADERDDSDDGDDAQRPEAGPWADGPDRATEPALAGAGSRRTLTRTAEPSRPANHGPQAESPFGRLSTTGGGLGLLDRPATTSAPAADGDTERDNGMVARDVATATIAAAAYTKAPLADIVDLRPRPVAPPTEIESAIRKGELDIIASLIDQGLLSTEGPISDRDVRTMVYVAFTSSELRKILLAGGTLDGDNANLDLGDVEVFADAPTAPTPLGTGSDTVIDLRDQIMSLPVSEPEFPVQPRAQAR